MYHQYHHWYARAFHHTNIRLKTQRAIKLHNGENIHLNYSLFSHQLVQVHNYVSNSILRYLDITMKLENRLFFNSILPISIFALPDILTTLLFLHSSKYIFLCFRWTQLSMASQWLLISVVTLKLFLLIIVTIFWKIMIVLETLSQGGFWRLSFAL